MLNTAPGVSSFGISYRECMQSLKFSRVVSSVFTAHLNGFRFGLTITSKLHSDLHLWSCARKDAFSNSNSLSGAMGKTKVKSVSLEYSRMKQRLLLKM